MSTRRGQANVLGSEPKDSHPRAWNRAEGTGFICCSDTMHYLGGLATELFREQNLLMETH